MLNIKAANYYFAKKKTLYKESKISEVKALSELQQDNWNGDDIAECNKQIFERVTKFFKRNLGILLILLTTIITQGCTDKDEECVLNNINGKTYYKKVGQVLTNRTYKVISITAINSSSGFVSFGYETYNKDDELCDADFIGTSDIISCDESTIKFISNDTTYNAEFSDRYVDYSVCIMRPGGSYFLERLK